MGTYQNLDHHEKEKIFSRRAKLAINELIQGKECAKQLQGLLLKEKSPLLAGEEDGFAISSSSSSTAEELLIKILRSLDDSLLVLKGFCSDGAGSSSSMDASPIGDLDDQRQQLLLQENSCNNCSDDRRLEDSGDSKKRPASAKDRRGCYKRKKNSQTWSKTSASIEDGHAWRKYGQKDILNATYPRSYFRCTRKYDQGCNATKQVQRIENEEKEVYQITYIGHHTCKNTINTPQIITSTATSENSVDPWNSCVMGSSSSITTTTTLATPIKQENFIKEESTPLSRNHNLITDENLTNSLDSIIWQDLMPLESSSSDQFHHSDLMISFRCSDYADFDSKFHFDESDQYFSF